VTDAKRLCECGCGTVLNGSKTRRYASDAHRKRHARAAARVAAPDPQPFDVDGHVKVRPALDEWLEGQHDLPAPLVAAAQALSAQVDMMPKSSPLWGRLTTVLTELMTPALEARQWSVEKRQVLEQVALAGHDDRWRAAKYREARDAGMDPTPWERVVPISCARGEHHWRDGRPQRRVCRYCDQVEEL
jgi:hypothetical protein